MKLIYVYLHNSFEAGKLAFTWQLIPIQESFHDLTVIYSCYWDMVQLVEKYPPANMPFSRLQQQFRNLLWGRSVQCQVYISETLQINDV